MRTTRAMTVGLTALALSAACGPPLTEEEIELEEFALAFEGIIKPPKLDTPSFSVKDMKVIQPDFRWEGGGPDLVKTSGAFVLDGLEFEFEPPAKTIWGEKRPPDNLVLLPASAVVKGDKIQLPGKEPITKEALGFLFSVGKDHKDRDRIAAAMEKKFGSDFGLEARYKEKTWFVGYGGYAYLTGAEGRGRPVGTGVSRMGKSALHWIEKGDAIGPAKIKSWARFLYGWKRELGDRRAYAVEKTRAFAGKADKARSGYDAEKRSWSREMKVLARELGIRRIAATKPAPAAGRKGYSTPSTATQRIEWSGARTLTDDPGDIWESFTRRGNYQGEFWPHIAVVEWSAEFMVPVARIQSENTGVSNPRLDRLLDVPFQNLVNRLEQGLDALDAAHWAWTGGLAVVGARSVFEANTGRANLNTLLRAIGAVSSLAGINGAYRIFVWHALHQYIDDVNVIHRNYSRPEIENPYEQ